jgi:hypothetical protein
MSTARKSFEGTAIRLRRVSLASVSVAFVLKATLSTARWWPISGQPMNICAHLTFPFNDGSSCCGNYGCAGERGDSNRSAYVKKAKSSPITSSQRDPVRYLSMSSFRSLLLTNKSRMTMPAPPSAIYGHHLARHLFFQELPILVLIPGMKASCFYALIQSPRRQVWGRV